MGKSHVPVSNYRLPKDTKRKLKELGRLWGANDTQVIISLIEAEHRYRREEIEAMKASEKEE